MPCGFFGLKRGKDVVLDCIRFKGLLIYSESSIISSVSVKIVGEFDNRPKDWTNTNTDNVLQKIIIRKKIRWEHIMGL